MKGRCVPGLVDWPLTINGYETRVSSSSLCVVKYKLIYFIVLEYVTGSQTKVLVQYLNQNIDSLKHPVNSLTAMIRWASLSETKRVKYVVLLSSQVYDHRVEEASNLAVESNLLTLLDKASGASVVGAVPITNRRTISTTHSNCW